MIQMPNEERAVQTAWGLSQATGRLVHVDEVASGRGSLICPSCASPLIAAKGLVRAAHFRHEIETDRPCSETVAHRLAKQIIAEARQLTVPHRYLESEVIQIGWDQSYLAVDVEPWLQKLTRRPDLIVSLPHQRMLESEALLIEIHVHHAVDQEKQHDFKCAGLTAMEISITPDLAALSQEQAAQKVLRDAYRRWISDPHGDAILERFRRAKEREAETRRQADEDARRRRQEATAESNRRREIWQTKALNDLESCKENAERHWECWPRPDTRVQKIEDEGLASLIGHRIAGDIALDMPPDVWQAGVLFDLYVLPIDSGGVDQIAPPTTKATSQWLKRFARLYQGDTRMFAWWYGDPSDPQVWKKISALQSYFKSVDPDQRCGTPWYVCKYMAQIWLSQRTALDSWASENLGRGRYS